MKAVLKLEDGTTVEMDGKSWRSADPLISRILTTRFPITSSPADGLPGSRQVYEAAKFLKCKVFWIGVPTNRPDAIY